MPEDSTDETYWDVKHVDAANNRSVSKSEDMCWYALNFNNEKKERTDQNQNTDEMCWN